MRQQDHHHPNLLDMVMRLLRMIKGGILIVFEIDFSSPWEEGFQASRDSIKENLYIVHPTHRQVLELCNKTLSPRIMVDFKRIR